MNLQELNTTKTQTQNGEEELKSFTFRNIPPTLHKLWKICAAGASITMEEFAINAIQKYITDITSGNINNNAPPVV